MDAAAVQALTQRLKSGLESDPDSALKACEDFELEACGEADSATMLPFYRVQIICYLLQDDLVNARWLWERMPEAIKADGEVQAAWKVAQLLWKRDLKSAYSALTDHKWSQPLAALSSKVLERLRSRNMKLIGASHSTIAVQDCAVMLGLSPQDAVKACAQQGWKEEGGFIMPVVVAEESTPVVNKELLQELTEYVCKLDAR
mmetsp:Transcript_39555/g.77458  ORF Transcript_39555/g.77458 Transcript_39555/m.77458 type:complete len:202 (-) Transcript_39555:81-686(-)